MRAPIAERPDADVACFDLPVAARDPAPAPAPRRRAEHRDPGQHRVGVRRLAALCFLCPNLWRFKWRFAWWEALVLTGMFIASISRMFVEKPFFYFQF